MKNKNMFILIPSGVLAAILLFLFIGQTYIKHGFEGGLKYDDRSSMGVEKYRARGARLLDRADYQRTNIAALEAQSRPSRQYYEDVKLVKGAPDSISLRDESQVNSAVIIVEPVLPQVGQGDKIIYTAEVRLEVENGSDAYKKAEGICSELGGYITSSNFNRNPRGQEEATVVMRIPKEKLSVALDKLGSLGKLKKSQTYTEDVSARYADLNAQLETAKIVYNKALEALKKRQADVLGALKTESELTPILRRIESLKNDIDKLNNAISFSTITVNFYEAQLSEKILKESSDQMIKDSFIKAKMAVVGFIAWLIASLPAFIVIVVFVGILAGVIAIVNNRIKKE